MRWHGADEASAGFLWRLRRDDGRGSMRQAGFEPTTFGSGGRRSIQLSYWRVLIADWPLRIADRARERRFGARSRSCHAIRNPKPTIRDRTVGASGFEPPTSWSRTRRANRTALRPETAPCNVHRTTCNVCAPHRVFPLHVARLNVARALPMRPERLELPAFWSVARRSIQLSYGRRMGGTRLELVTSTMSTWRSNQLS
jgi:hypothetical protein